MIIEVKVPQLSESVAEATLLDWHKKEGEPVSRDENLIDIETDKVVLELPAPSDGVLVKILKQSRDPVPSGDVIAQIDTDAKAAAALSPEKKSLPEKSKTAPAVMPAARKIAAEQGIDTSKIPGTGRDGRVTKGDVLEQAAKASAAKPPLQQPSPPVDIDALLSGRPEQRVPMSRLRQRVAERLVQRSEEHTTEPQSPCNLVCRLLLEKKKYTAKLQSPWNQVCRLSLKKKNTIHRYHDRASRDTD